MMPHSFARILPLNHDAFLMAAADDNGYNLEKYRLKIEAQIQKKQSEDGKKSARPDAAQLNSLMEGNKSNK